MKQVQQEDQRDADPGQVAKATWKYRLLNSTYEMHKTSQHEMVIETRTTSIRQSQSSDSV